MPTTMATMKAMLIRMLGLPGASCGLAMIDRSPDWMVMPPRQLSGSNPTRKHMSADGAAHFKFGPLAIEDFELLFLAGQRFSYFLFFSSKFWS